MQTQRSLLADIELPSDFVLNNACSTTSENRRIEYDCAPGIGYIAYLGTPSACGLFPCIYCMLVLLEVAVLLYWYIALLNGYALDSFNILDFAK